MPPIYTTTEGLKGAIDNWQGEGNYQSWITLAQTYHLSRLADATERIASHIENNQISTLEGADIVNQLAVIAGRIH